MALLQGCALNQTKVHQKKGKGVGYGLVSHRMYISHDLPIYQKPPDILNKLRVEHLRLAHAGACQAASCG